jgi:hypothetical protein
VPDAGLILPAGSVLLHIGPYKTGTTAIQASLERHRADLPAYGVIYPGSRRRQARPVFALIGRGLPGMPVVPEQEWLDLVAEVRRAAAQRVMISSEDFSTLDAQQVARVVRDLGAERVHVLTVARNLSPLLPSGWQERVKSVNETRSYEEWLAEVLAPEPTEPPASVFWRHHSLANLLGTWTDAVPAERVTVVVADESDRSQLRHLCEALLGLPDGLLTEAPADNASLTWNRVELYRELNRAAASGAWSDRAHRRLLYRGLLQGLAAADVAPGEAPIPRLPAWAVARVAELSRERVKQLLGSGARVVGDPDLLLADSGTPSGPEVEVPDALPIEAAVRGLESMVEALRRDKRGKGGDDPVG